MNITISEEAADHVLEVITVLEADHTVESYVEYCIGLASTTQFFTKEEYKLFYKMLQRVENETK